MSKKLIYLVSLIFVLALVTASYSDVVIGNFEQEDDGWDECTWEPPGEPTLTYSDTYGVTLDSYSLKGVQPTDGFNWFLMKTTVDADDFRANNIISMDVTRLSNQWTRIMDPNEEHWSYIDLRVQDNNRYSLVGLGNRGEWDSNDVDANDTMTLTWDYTSFKETVPEAATQIQIVFASNDGGYTGNGTWYFDNIRLTASRNEQPRNGSWGVQLDPTLRWDEKTVGADYDIYVGTDEAAVTDANRTSHPGLLVFEQDWDPNNYPLTGTTNGSTYYWRVDEVVGGVPTKADVWHFTTFFLGAEVTVIGDWEEQMDGWVAVNPDDINMVLGYSANGATLHDYSLSVGAPSGWYNSVEIDLEDAGFTYQLLANNRFSLDVTWNTDEFTGDIESISIDGDEIGASQIGPTSKTEIGTQGSFVTTRYSWDYSGVDFRLLPADPNLTLSIATMADDAGTYYFDNARLYNGKLATDPRPRDTVTDVQRDPNLIWTPGEGAATHDVYFGTDEDAVTDANSTSHPGLLFSSLNRPYGNTEIDIAAELGAPLSFGTTYYWRVDEVNDLTWEGAVWRFTVGYFVVVDDFESYSSNPKPLGDTWIAGGNADVSLSTDPVHGGAQAMAIDYNNNPAPYYSEVYADTNAAGLGFGNDWTVEGVEGLVLWFRGYEDLRGSYTVTGPNSYTIEADGWDIWEQSDGFHYAYKQVATSGVTDWVIETRVASVEPIHDWSKAGIMVRKTLEPGSRHISLFVTPASGVTFEWRDTTDGDTEDLVDANLAAPRWLKLMRVKAFGIVVAQQAPDVGGSAGTYKGIGEFEDNYGLFTSPIYLGLAVTSHSDGEMCTADFNNLLIEAPVHTNIGIPAESKDIGIPYNAPEPMYVILQDSDSNAIVYYDDKDPNATQTADWTQWGIELDEFEDVNLTDVQRMYIGIGDRTIPTPDSGSGTIHVDDIQLYKPYCIHSKRSAGFAEADYAPEGAIAGDCVVDYREIEVMGRDWLQSPPPNQDVDLYDDEMIDFRDLAVLGQYWLVEELSVP